MSWIRRLIAGHLSQMPGLTKKIPLEFPVDKEKVGQVWLRILRHHSTKDNAHYFFCHRGNIISEFTAFE